MNLQKIYPSLLVADMAATVPAFAGMTHGKLGLHGLDVLQPQEAGT